MRKFCLYSVHTQLHWRNTTNFTSFSPVYSLWSGLQPPLNGVQMTHFCGLSRYPSLISTLGPYSTSSQACSYLAPPLFASLTPLMTRFLEPGVSSNLPLHVVSRISHSMTSSIVTTYRIQRALLLVNRRIHSSVIFPSASVQKHSPTI